MFDNIHFANPLRLWLLLILLGLAVWYFFKIRNSHATLKISNLEDFGGKTVTFRTIMAYLPNVLNFLIITLIIIALARPQTITGDEKITKEGIDIILATDISGSMLAADLKPNRLEAAKQVASDFISSRENDRMGIVLFGSESFTQCPLTSDKSTLLTLMNNIKQGIVNDGTAIGLGLANSVARLKDSDAKSKVVILLTDGENNSGEVAPLMAADIAATFGVRVYTIGVGRNGMAPYPVQDVFGHTSYQNMEVHIDENTLKQIAETTGGKYFRATDNKALKNIYEEIDKLEKTKMQTMTTSHVHDKFMPFLIGAICLIFINLVLKFTVARIIP